MIYNCNKTWDGQINNYKLLGDSLLQEAVKPNIDKTVPYNLKNRPKSFA